MKKIKTLSEYVQEINGITKSIKRDILSEDKLFFRGQSRDNMSLLPSIGRQPTGNVHNPLIIYEKRLIKEAKRVKPEMFQDSKYPFNLLVKLQHYGMPTRLLDVSYNALCALFFACYENNNEDGEVFVFKVNSDEIHTYESLASNVIADMNEISEFNKFKFNDFYEMEREKKYFSMFPDMPAEERIAKLKERVCNPIFVLPREEFERQKKQSGAVILFPNIIKGNSVLGKIKEISRTDNVIAKIMTIDKEYKRTLTDELKYVGISKTILFADNPDVVCDEIKRNSLSLFDSKTWNYNNEE